MNKTGAPRRYTEGSNVADQPAREENIAAIEQYFKSGIKAKKGPESVGIELEHTVVHEDGRPVSYTDEFGIAWLLEQLRGDFSQATYDEEGDLLGLAREGEAVTLEPAAQVELSAGPFSNLKDAQRVFTHFQERLTRELEPHKMKLLTLGYHPTARAEELSLIPKRRYQFMNLYFEQRGSYGLCMMRGSASTQVSIDCHSVDDCLRKLRLCGIAAPLLSLICDNAPIFEGAPRTHHMVRTKIWQGCDPARCNTVPGSLEPDFSLRKYAEYLLDTPAILIPCTKEGLCYTERCFGDIYAKNPMSRAQVEHMVSMFFTDVRLKTYVEIRPADALPVPYAIAYAALVKGLFTLDASLDVLDELFEGIGQTEVDAAKEALMKGAYGAQVYGRSAADLADELMKLASCGLEAEERAYLEPLAHLVTARTTLAEKDRRE